MEERRVSIWRIYKVSVNTRKWGEKRKKRKGKNNRYTRVTLCFTQTVYFKHWLTTELSADNNRLLFYKTEKISEAVRSVLDPSATSLMSKTSLIHASHRMFCFASPANLRSFRRSAWKSEKRRFLERSNCEDACVRGKAHHGVRAFYHSYYGSSSLTEEKYSREIHSVMVYFNTLWISFFSSFLFLTYFTLSITLIY